MISIVVAALVTSAAASAETIAITLRADQLAPASIPAIAKILERRFKSLEPGFFTSVEAQVIANKITLRFGGWSPSSKQINYLTSTHGKFRLIMEGESRPLVTQADVADARPISSGARSELAIRLTESAAERVAALTRGVSGKLALIEWEGRVLDRIRITGPLSRDMALSFKSDEDISLVSAALRGGALPDELRLVPLK
ncbi:hypothetical protein [Pseudoduganella violaceinigra]|uniref:hypothetical protein n=1 Tax=Pseudoduganella violaceinigra TaxID=246602 RepID=UPI000489CC2E|nr:hypothetical protein [Pseudoduganella violaceinigra]